MELKTDGSRPGLSLIGSPSSLKDGDFIQPPWIWRPDGTRRHFYEDHAYYTEMLVKSIRFHDVEGSELVRWKIAARERKAFAKWQDGYRQIQEVKKARCLSKDGSYVVEYECDECGMSTNVRSKNAKIFHEDEARFYRNADSGWSFWNTYLRKANKVLLVGIDKATPKEIANPEKEQVVILPINGREYIFLCKSTGRGIAFLPFSFPVPGEGPPVVRFIGNYSTILNDAMTRTMPEPTLTYEVSLETISSKPNKKTRKK